MPARLLRFVFVGASVFDPEATFDYHLPWEFQGGAAYVRDRAQLEVEIQTFGSISPFALLATDQPTIIYGDAGQNVAPTVITRPFPGLTSAADAVVNVGIGGHVRVTKDRPFRVHAGLANDNSPVAAEDQVFHHVDMLSWTIGASGAIGKLQFAVGVNRRSGTADDLVVRNILRNDPVRTAVDIHNTGFIYSLAYQF